MNSKVISFRKRKLDWLILFFFLLNLFFITYVVDFEQLAIPDPYHYEQPVWPPAFMVTLIHAYGQANDPLLMARPQWWKDTIMLDVFIYGPFYAAAVYAFIKGKEWIRIPAFLYSGMMFADVLIILGEEIAGPHATPHLPLVLALNLPWLLLPILLTMRLRHEHPFTTQVEPSAPKVYYETDHRR
jgi:hypothetical protein